MPYIDSVAKDRLEESPPTTVGELNYVLTSMAIDYIKDKGLSYANINHVMGSFELCKIPKTKFSGAPEEYKLPLSFLGVLFAAENAGVANALSLLGVVASAQAEFYRRVAVPYEDAKIALNGDVYPDQIDGFRFR